MAYSIRYWWAHQRTTRSPGGPPGTTGPRAAAFDRLGHSPTVRRAPWTTSCAMSSGRSAARAARRSGTVAGMLRFMLLPPRHLAVKDEARVEVWHHDVGWP